MEKLCRRWRETGQWSRLNARKTLFMEPRGGSQEDFDAVLKGYYSSINKGSKPAIGKRRKAKKVDDNDLTATDSLTTCKDGAAFLAVCRGKVSEGIDFSDDNARTVIIVGIPFPSMHDIQILEKKKYNDTYKHSKNLLSGSDWYCQQAFRALNQAAGRCIRHRFDYGAIILLDERFREERNTMYISKWLRKSIRTSDNLMKSVEELTSFFRNAKERIDSVKNVQDSVSDLENIPPNDSGELSVKRKNKRLGIPQLAAKRKVLDNMKPSVPLNSLSFQDDGLSGDMTSRTQLNEEFLDSSPKYLSNMEIPRGTAGINHNSSEVLRCDVPVSTSLDEVMELSVIKETPPMNGSCIVASPDASMDNDNSRSTLIQTSEFGQENFVFSLDQDVTPERNSLVTGCMPLTDSSTNLSVNSHAHKRRMSLNSLLINSIQGKKLNMTSGEVTDNFKVRSNDSNHIPKFAASKEIPLECDHQSTMTSPSAVNSADKSPKLPSLCLNQQSQIFCSLCKSSLSPETNPYIMCCLTSLSKAIFASSSEEKEQKRTRVVIVDSSSVDKRVCATPGQQGVWFQEDGCVYNSIFCPYCVSRNHCLGFQILATDASNFQLINKILFYYDRLEVKTYTELEKKVNGDICSRQVSGVEVLTSAALRKACEENGSCGDGGVGIHSIEKFAYQSPKQSSGGWRTTKPKSKLVKGKASQAWQC